MTRVRLTGDPADWSVVRRITFVCFMPEGEVALTPSRALPSDWLRPDEHPLDACLRARRGSPSHEIHLDFATVGFTETGLTAVETVGLAD